MAKRKAKQSTDGVKKHVIEIPRLEQKAILLRLIGDRPLLVNNKLGTAEEVAARYTGAGGTKRPKPAAKSAEQLYQGAFYTLASSPVSPPNPKGLYGVPSSGIKKCFQKGIRPAGFTDNTTIGQIGKGFDVCADERGLCLVRHNGFVQDDRMVNIGSGQKTVPQKRYRPLFPAWEIHVRLVFNANLLSEVQLANLAMYAGQYIGLCELRAEKMQGECGGFVVGSFDKLPAWATDKHWGVKSDAVSGFRILKKPRKRAA